jgi:hypothetical protein
VTPPFAGTDEPLAPVAGYGEERLETEAIATTVSAEVQAVGLDVEAAEPTRDQYEPEPPAAEEARPARVYSFSEFGAPPAFGAPALRPPPLHEALPPLTSDPPAAASLGEPEAPSLDDEPTEQAPAETPRPRRRRAPSSSRSRSATDADSPLDAGEGNPS